MRVLTDRVSKACFFELKPSVSYELRVEVDPAIWTDLFSKITVGVSDQIEQFLVNEALRWA
jgi:hypothetical protein